jgi:hypothetical protein
MSSNQTISFSGTSDDLIEVEGNVPGCDEYNHEWATFHVAGLRVRVSYEEDGVWSVWAAQISEDVPVTATNVDLRAVGYSMVLTMDVPSGSYVSKAAHS